MNLKIYFLAFIIFYSNKSIRAQNKFPTYNEVITWTFKNYKNLENGFCNYDFIKNKDGWFLKINNLSQKSDTSFLVWSSKKNTFFINDSIVDFKNLPPKYDNIRAKYLLYNSCDSLIKSKFNNKFFDLLPYYGYPNWYNDVINDFENKSPKNNFALCYAYYFNSIELFNYKSAYENFSLPKKVKENYRFDKNKLDTISELTKTANFYFTQINKNDSLVYNWNEVEGPIFLINMYNWFLLKLHNKDSLANESLENIKLPSSLLLEAQKWLQYKNENVICFLRNGNLFYTLSYLQAKHVISKKLILLNTLYLNKGNYINFINKTYNNLLDNSFVYSVRDIDLFSSNKKKSYNSKIKSKKAFRIYKRSANKSKDNQVVIAKNIYKIYVPKRNMAFYVKGIFGNELLMIFIINQFPNFKIAFNNLSYGFIDDFKIFEDGYVTEISFLKGN